MAGTLIDRRSLLHAAGAAGLAGLWPSSVIAGEFADPVFASAYYRKDGTFGVVLLSQNGEVLGQFRLPERGHDVVFAPGGGSAVVFARRPGNFAIGFDVSLRSEPVTFTTLPDRHFYGHGTFSADGTLLFATENDFDNASGIVGIYKALNGYKRIGEFSSHGIGPHEMVLMPDQRTLAIANGGIETHPDFGRTKLNINDMEPSVVFIDSRTGDLLDRHVLPAELRQLSVRHLCACGNRDVAFAGQYEGPANRRPPLIGQIRQGGRLTFHDIDGDALASLRNYTGSIAASRDFERIAVSSPRGGTVLVLRRGDGRILKRASVAYARGLAPVAQGFVSTTGDGGFAQIGPDLVQRSALPFAFDNHLAFSLPG